MIKSFFTIFILTGTIAGFSYLFASCRKDGNPNNLHWMQQPVPAGFPTPVFRFAGNPLSEEGFELGKKLFYDGRLSVDGNHPCSSCHQQIAAFGTFEHDRSHGVNGTHTLRNAPVLFNLAWQSRFHWDGEFNSLYEEAAHPIHGMNEMGETFTSVINKLQADEDYRKMFRKVFRTEFISPDLVLKALAQFTGYLTSANSKYDLYKKGQTSFTAQEQNGYQVFLTNCSSCHPEPLFTDFSFRNIGLPIDPFLNDFGRLRITHDIADSLKFKVPTLRNVYITSNYMHDGRFNTLAQCINHYRTGVQKTSTLDPLLQNGITLTDAEASNLAIFLRTLTDSSFIKDVRFSEF
jgi:cytochrome c peroxidase